MPNYHVVKNKKTKMWEAKKENTSRISGAAKTQKEAEKLAKIFLAHTGGGEVRIHGLDGKIRDSDTVKPGKEGIVKDIKH